jgi:hypothetical protein
MRPRLEERFVTSPICLQFAKGVDGLWHLIEDKTHSQRWCNEAAHLWRLWRGAPVCLHPTSLGSTIHFVPRSFHFYLFQFHFHISKPLPWSAPSNLSAFLLVPGTDYSPLTSPVTPSQWEKQSLQTNQSFPTPLNYNPMTFMPKWW